MNFNELDLYRAQRAGIITSQQLEQLYTFLKNNISNNIKNTEKTHNISKTQTANGLNIMNLLYYTGGVVIIIAMGWFLGNFWNNSPILLLISAFYSVCFFFIAEYLWKQNYKTPAGLLYACCVSSLPLVVFAFEKLCGLFDEGTTYNNFHILIRARWIVMEIIPIIAGIYLLKIKKQSIIALPIAYALWYLSMDIVPLFVANLGDPTWGQRNFASILISSAMLLFAYNCDTKKEEYSFWFYIFGATILYGAVCSAFMQWKLFDSVFGYLLIFLLSIGYMCVSFILKRKIFTVWGAIGTISTLLYVSVTSDKNPLYGIFMSLIALLYVNYAENVYKYKDNCSTLFYFFGVTTLYSAISSYLLQYNEFGYFLIFLLSVAYMFISIMLKKKLYLIWGAMGFIGYLFHLADTIFHDSPLYPIVLIFIGLGIIYAGIWYNKNAKKLFK